MAKKIKFPIFYGYKNVRREAIKLAKVFTQKICSVSNYPESYFFGDRNTLKTISQVLSSFVVRK